MTTERVAIYVVTACLLALAVYLKSSFVAGAAVCLIAVEYAKDILLKLQENTKVLEMEAFTKKLEARIADLEKDTYAVANRVKETLGDL